MDGITDGHEFEQAPGVGDGQGSLMCCRVRHDWVTELNWNKKYKAYKNYAKDIDCWHEKLHNTLINEKVTTPREHYSFLKIRYRMHWKLWKDIT